MTQADGERKLVTDEVPLLYDASTFEHNAEVVSAGLRKVIEKYTALYKFEALLLISDGGPGFAHLY